MPSGTPKARLSGPSRRSIIGVSSASSEGSHLRCGNPLERGSPWENGYIESFNARLRDELLNGEIFYPLQEAQIVIESWRCHYNTM
jgi:hypothetical protein